MRSKTALVLSALALVLFALPAAGFAGDQGTQGYVVQMLADPVVAYDGGVSGIPATKPGKGKKIDPASSDVQKYAAYLKAQHGAAAGKVGADKTRDYVYSFNGFAARMNDAQAEALKTVKNVVAVTPDELQSMDTSSTPAFLGLSDKGGLWDQLGGVSKNGLDRGAGEDIVIGDIDSGIWPESMSFSDRKVDGSNGNLYPHKVTGYSGTCQTGEGWTATDCNNKIIGARYFNTAWGGNAGIDAQRPWEFDSPRDYNGHGTHTAGTAGGNFGTPTTGPAAAFGAVSGMAPRARISVYKALWSTKDASTASGFTSDLVEAIDQAVADGVDVITYSISGTLTNYLDPVEVSFLFAADAGIFVSAAAGNEGPGSSTVNHPSPWEMTVAAGTHNRSTIGTVKLGNGATYTGASTAPNAVSAPIVNSTAVGASGADPNAVRLCFSAVTNGGTPVLDPAKVGGKIVVCERGTNARVDKSLAVQQAGGVGMVLVNTSPNTLNGDLHSVPTVHLQNTDRAAVEAYAATAGATATIHKSVFDYSTPAPLSASFSSRGPSLAGGGNLLKPDVMAPGVDVLAAVAPPGNGGLDFNLLSGTSMATPHVAGVAALLKQLHPDWSPMEVKSALMTSGYDVLDGSPTSAATLFTQGAGYIKPNSAADPGLVFDSGFNDWLAFLCGTNAGLSASTCNALKNAGYSLDPSDLNTASIAIGGLAGAQTVKRTVTNVGKKTSTYTASANVPGLNVSVSPSSFTLNPGAKQALSITITRTTASLGSYAGGQLTFSDGTHSVRIPVVAKPVAVSAPAEVTGNGSPISYNVKTGYAGTLNFAARGLVAATATPATVAQDPDQTFNRTDPTGTYSKSIVVPAGTKLFRVGIDQRFITPSGTDLDVYLYNGSTLVGQSADGDSNEMVTLVNPAPATYTVYVHGFSTNGPSANFTLFDWELGSASAGNMTVPGPAAATIGGTVPVNLTFTGLAPSSWYLGQVIYNDGSSDVGSTIVSVLTP